MDMYKQTLCLAIQSSKSLALVADGDSAYKGVHRAILLASIAKAQGMKWSYKNGLVDRESNETITKNPAEIAQNLINGTQLI
jgi:hypothetical protein